MVHCLTKVVRLPACIIAERTCTRADGKTETSDIASLDGNRKLNYVLRQIAARLFEASAGSRKHKSRLRRAAFVQSFLSASVSWIALRVIIRGQKCCPRSAQQLTRVDRCWTFVFLNRSPPRLVGKDRKRRSVGTGRAEHERSPDA